MSNAIATANLLQSKIGTSLAGVTNLLPPPERNEAILAASTNSLPVAVLGQVKLLQEKTIESVNNVSAILQSQLDIAEEQERRERDQAAELDKEKRRLKNKAAAGAGGVGGDVDDINENLDEIEDSINKGRFSELLTGGLTAALLAPGALKNMGKGIGKKLLKGGLYGALATIIADPVIEFIDGQFDLELDEDAKSDLKLGMIGAGVGLGLAGIPGAIIGASAGMMAKVGQYIAGTVNAEEIKDVNFAGTAIGGAAGAMFGTAKLAAYIKGGGLASIGATTQLGVAMGSLPVIIGVGAAVALGVGAMYLVKKVDEYQERTLNKLEETTAQLDKEMGAWAAREEEGLFERMGINLGNLSALGEAKVAAQEASEQLGQDKEKFLANTQMQSKLSALATTMLRYSDEALGTILKDGTKATNFLDTVENIKNIAAKGGFGDDSKQIFEAMAAFSDRVQNVAIKLVDDGVKISSVGQNVALNKAGIGGDQLENLPEMQREKNDLLAQQAEVRLQLEEARAKLKDLNEQGIKSKFFGENEAEKTEDLIKKLEGLVGDDGQGGTIQRDLNKLESEMLKFGTTNGLLYNLDELKELYADDPGRLRLLIERSVNQSGTAFLDAMKSDTRGAKADGIIAPNILNTNNNNQSIMKETNYFKKLDASGDPYFMREAYTYGSI